MTGSTEKLPLSPMLVQYLVGLCALRWDAEAVDVSVTLGGMVQDVASETTRDVDVTVTASDPDGGVHAFKGYEVKHWKNKLDVADVEALVAKFNDMPSVTHRAIVTTSGYTEPAIRKAAHHGVDLYVIADWVKPLEEQFPELAPMGGKPEEAIRGMHFFLNWKDWSVWLGMEGNVPNFTIDANAPIFDETGRPLDFAPTYSALVKKALMRSVDLLVNLDPIVAPMNAAIETHSPPSTIPDLGERPHSHTLDAGTLGAHIVVDGKPYKIDTITLSGSLVWDRQEMKYCVMERVPDGDAFAGAVISIGQREGQMTALLFSPKDRNIEHRPIQLLPDQLNSIRNLEIAAAGGPAGPK
ncbi:MULTISPECIES: restriction endonuclease [Tsukamurella]|uniref:Restriction endonuclease n=1 Tax=Tsukamurella asaccharolytica TaxID=2592067 RepID=A0A5C5R622_9ACTN|nr:MULTISPECIES: restriction endonuclease [Tsukamurella]TWS17773.1 restriction endonuclease [Tsukamurella asaccharolytica]